MAWTTKFKTNLSNVRLKAFFETFPSLLPKKVPWSPLGFLVWLTTSCNLRCEFCYQTIVGLKKMILKKEVLKRLPLEGKSLTFCGLGEPLMHPNFLEFIKAAKSKGATVSFSTNGVLLTKDVAERLVELGVDKITFSIDGMGDVYERIRKGSSFDKVVKNLRHLHEWAKLVGHPKLELTFVGLTTNIDQFPRVVEFFSPFVSEVRFNHVAPYSQEIADMHALRLPKEKLSAVFDEARRLADQHGVRIRFRPLEPEPSRVCWEPWVQPYVALDGTIYPCCILGDHHGLNFTEYFEDAPVTYDLEQYAMGNVMESDVKEIWNCEKFVEFRGRLKKLSWQSKRKWTLREYVELRKKETDFFCEICSYRWGMVC